MKSSPMPAALSASITVLKSSVVSVMSILKLTAEKPEASVLIVGSDTFMAKGAAS